MQFRSSVELGATCAHECTVVGPGGAFWPAPTFVVTATDRQLEPLVAKSCTGCWSAVSSRDPNRTLVSTTPGYSRP